LTEGTREKGGGKLKRRMAAEAPLSTNGRLTPNTMLAESVFCQKKKSLKGKGTAIGDARWNAIGKVRGKPIHTKKGKALRRGRKRVFTNMIWGKTARHSANKESAASLQRKRESGVF